MNWNTNQPFEWSNDGQCWMGMSLAVLLEIFDQATVDGMSNTLLMVHDGSAYYRVA